MPFEYPVISADSHITEPPDSYTTHIDPAFRDQAPHMITDDERGDVFVVDGMKNPIAMGLVAAAGKPAEEITESWACASRTCTAAAGTPTARLADQDRDGVAAEIIYPTVGMVLCNHRDFDYKKACFDAYNRWIAEYCARAPDRLLGIGQTAMRSPEEGIADLAGDQGARPARRDDAGRRRRDRGLRLARSTTRSGRRPIELGLPLSFHILTTRGRAARAGRAMNSFLSIVRGCQDIMGMLVLRRRVRAPPRPQGRVRRGRRRLGAALHVPDGPRLQAPPQLAAARPGAVEAAVASTSPRTST